MSTVTCSTCGTANPAGQKFCGECAAPLPRLCPSCGASGSPTQRFCGECGSPLSGISPVDVATRPAAVPAPTESEGLEQERRLVTILFADLVGSTALGESLDPEELYEVVHRVHSRVEESIVRFGGYVARHLGDGLMALFGAPVAQEDDAERAVLAGLAMQRALAALNGAHHDGTPLEMRVGVTSGEVVAGAMAGVYDVLGDAANVAARLQGAAPVGGVLVGEETMRLARRRVRFGERQALTLKGKAQPVAAYVALGVREQVGERWDEGKGAGHATPLIGREAELAIIQDTWQRARVGEGQLVTIIGEPGVGKSRLVAEGLAQITAEGTGPQRVLRGRCLSYGQSVSLWLIADLLRSLCSLPEEAGREAVSERIGRTVETILAGRDATDRAIAHDVLGEVLGLPPGSSLVAQADPRLRRSALIRTLGMILGSLSESGPLALVLEDLHWLDTASGEILEEVLPEVAGRPVLVLATQRPGWSAPWSGTQRVPCWTERLTLRPLAEDEVSALAAAALGGARLSPQLEAHLRERAEGNPFFVEELVRYLQETGRVERHDGEVRLLPGAAERLPATLSEVLMARLDRLEHQVKVVAQAGSVIGRNFAVRLLARVMERKETALDGPLHALQQAEIAFPKRGGDLEYAFKHVTVRDVAYGMLLQRRRRQLHLQTARAMTQLFPIGEYVELIAYHYARTEADGEAATWLEKAGDRARDTYANEAAIEHYQAALERLTRSGAEGLKQARIEVKLGWVLNRASRHQEAEKVLESAIQRYREEGDLEGAGRATEALGFALSNEGKLEEASRRMEEMAGLLAERDPSVAAWLQHGLANVYQYQGRYGEMLAAGERAVELAGAAQDRRGQGIGQERRGTALNFLGRIEEGREAMVEAIRLLEGVGDLLNLGVATANLGENRRVAGELVEAVHLWERGLQLAVRAGNTRDEMLAHVTLAQILVATGDWKEAEGHVQKVERLGQAHGTVASMAPFVPCSKGELALREGDWTAAHQLLKQAAELASGVNAEAVELARTLLAELAILNGRAEEARDRLEELVDDEGANLPLALPILAWAQLELGETERGLELAERAERETRERQTLLYLAEALRTKGMALRGLGRTEEARQALREGRARAAAMPNPYTEARILVELGLLDRQHGEADQAREHLQEGLTIFRRLGAGKDIERTEGELARLDRAVDLTR